jgi:hypothetical protein
LQVRALDAEPPGPCARREDQDVVGDRLTAFQHHGLGVTVDPSGTGVQPQRDIVLGVEGFGLEQKGVRVGLTLEPGLRQRGRW